jgi:hypothetical protein
MIKRLSLFLIGFALITQAFGQAEEKLGSWYIYNGFYNFSPKFELFFDTQYRSFEPIDNPQRFLVRPYFNYNFTKNAQAGLGVEYHKLWTYDEEPGNKQSAEEFRITLQGILSQKVSRLAFQHRYRYEFQNIGDTKLQRMRYRLQTTLPLNNPSLSPGTIFLDAYFEIFISTSTQFSFNQNWAYGAIGYQFTEKINLQLGYLAVLQQVRTLSRLQFFFTHKLFFYEK